MSGAEPGDASCDGGANDDSYEVELDHQGETISVTVDEDQPVLDAAEEIGLDLPYSCRKGQCTSCAGRLLEGDLDQRSATALDPAQKDDGFALLCVARPESDCRIETEAQEDMFGMDIR